MPTIRELAEARVRASKPSNEPAAAVNWWAFEFARRQKLAATYRRDESKIHRLLDGHPDRLDLWCDLQRYPDDPRVTWRLLRALCQARRAVKPSVDAHYNLGVLAYDGKLDAVIAGEILLLKHQRANLKIAAE